MKPTSLSDKCSKHIRWQDLINCGETQATTGIENLPKERQSWEALAELAQKILDPVTNEFGQIELTFGFCSPELYKAIPRGTSAKHDQHHAHEINKRGNLFCDRRGAAVDFRSECVSSLIIAKWIVSTLPFDRLYFYGDDRPVHVSYRPDHTRQIVIMRQSEKFPDRKIPSVMSLKKFLDFDGI